MDSQILKYITYFQNQQLLVSVSKSPRHHAPNRRSFPLCPHFQYIYQINPACKSQYSQIGGVSSLPMLFPKSMRTKSDSQFGKISASMVNTMMKILCTRKDGKLYNTYNAFICCIVIMSRSKYVFNKRSKSLKRALIFKIRTSVFHKYTNLLICMQMLPAIKNNVSTRFKISSNSTKIHKFSSL